MKILVTGETNTVRKFVELTFANLGIELEWKGTAEEEKGIISAIKKEKLKIKKEELLEKNQPTNLPAIAKAEEGHPIRHSVDSILNSYSLILNSELVSINSHYFRPTKVDLLIGDTSKAKSKLGWQAETKLEKLVETMVNSDFNKVLEKGYY